MKITIDHREKRSGIEDLLRKHNFNISWKNLAAGDYIVEDRILIERKTVGDFIASLKSGRLFNQCKKLTCSKLPLLMIIEGVHEEFKNRISPQSLQGALISITSAWQIPIIYTDNVSTTVESLVRIGTQQIKKRELTYPKIIQTQTIHGSQVFFLQNLPQTGPKLTLRLIRHFGSTRAIANASIDELTYIEGIGKQKAALIFNFFRKEL